MLSDKMAKTYDYLFKLLLIGDSGVGKTCVLFRFSEDAFNTTFISTIGIDFKIRTIELDGKKIKLQIWDTAGQERFRTITTAYYRGAMGIMLVYDITNEKSFENIKNWIRNIEENAAADVEKMLLGNKCELTEKRQVSRERGEQLAVEYGIKFLETSAKASINVEEAFFTLARDIKAKMEKKLLVLNFVGGKQPSEGWSTSAESIGASEETSQLVVSLHNTLTPPLSRCRCYPHSPPFSIYSTPRKFVAVVCCPLVCLVSSVTRWSQQPRLSCRPSLSKTTTIIETQNLNFRQNSVNVPSH
ncbi:hypothetical protein B566_EDAN007764 [Ephemera danica]|nr:hypothetical protein B566_EDAN007764 [Ephemera danica]